MIGLNSQKSLCRIGRSSECTERGCQFARHFNAHCFGEKIKSITFPSYENLVKEDKGLVPVKKRIYITRVKKRPKAKDTIRRRKIYNDGNGICHLCKLPVEYDYYTIDHVIPKSKGGSNMMSNLKPAHYDCNQEKGDKI